MNSLNSKYSHQRSLAIFLAGTLSLLLLVGCSGKGPDPDELKIRNLSNSLLRLHKNKKFDKTNLLKMLEKQEPKADDPERKPEKLLSTAINENQYLINWKYSEKKPNDWLVVEVTVKENVGWVAYLEKNALVTESMDLGVFETRFDSFPEE